MIILAIETSCDETAVSIIAAEGGLAAPKFKILAHQVASQISTHAPWGGVVPSLAKREHGKNLVPILIAALKQAGLYIEFPTSNLQLPTSNLYSLAPILEREPELLATVKTELTKISKPEIDAIAVTQGPGLEPTLWVGINLAKVLSLAWQLPLIPTNHLEGHVVSVLAPDPTKEHSVSIKFPAIALIISGGHTELVLVKSFDQYQKIGGTRDDAAGEAFDKVARLLGLPYPGGPEISRLANEAKSQKLKAIFNLPRPMINSDDFDFSFSGLKTAVRYGIEKHGQLSADDKKTLAKEFEDAVIEVLLAKTKKALATHQVKTLIIGGGVVANQAIRHAFQNLISNLQSPISNIQLLIPNLQLSTDNATMIGLAAYLNYMAGQYLKPEQVLAADDLIARGNLALK